MNSSSLSVVFSQVSSVACCKTESCKRKPERPESEGQKGIYLNQKIGKPIDIVAMMLLNYYGTRWAIEGKREDVTGLT